MYLSCLILPLPHTTWVPLIPNHLLFYNVLYFQNRVPFICYLLESDCEESWAPKNWCFWPVVLEKTLESPLDWKDIQPVHPKRDQSWVFIGRTDAEAETPVLWPPHAKSWLIGRPWCWEGLGAGGEGDDRGWDGWMASPTRWTWVWVNSGSWWWTGRPGVLQFMGSQRVRHTDRLNWTEPNNHLRNSHSDVKILLTFLFLPKSFSDSSFSLAG